MFDTFSGCNGNIVFSELDHAAGVLKRGVFLRHAILIHLVGPGLPVVLPGLGVIAREETIQFARPLKSDSREACVGVIDYILFEVELVLKNILDHASQERDVRAGAQRRVQVRLGRRSA